MRRLLLVVACSCVCYLPTQAQVQLLPFQEAEVSKLPKSQKETFFDYEGYIGNGVYFQKFTEQGVKAHLEKFKEQVVSVNTVAEVNAKVAKAKEEAIGHANDEVAKVAAKLVKEKKDIVSGINQAKQAARDSRNYTDAQIKSMLRVLSGADQSELKETFDDLLDELVERAVEKRLEEHEARLKRLEMMLQRSSDQRQKGGKGRD